MAQSKTSKSILIVEDERPLRRVLAEKLEHEGFEIFEAGDGERGLVEAFKRHPNLILLDILLPKMDGITMMKKLRKDVWGKGVPVILLTNLNLDDTRMQEIVEHQPAFYLVKSDWALDDVVRKIKERIVEQGK